VDEVQGFLYQSITLERCLSLKRSSFSWVNVHRFPIFFCGNHDVAENAAIIYSLIGCCKACDVNPREWLTDILTRISEYNSNYDLDLADLLPHNWKRLKKSLQQTPTPFGDS
jgi:transposase